MSKILIVDDDKDISELISLILKKEDIDSDTVNNPLDVFNKIKSEVYDLILLDIMMPNISGTELCSKIRNEVNCPIIFLSAKNEVVDKIVGYEIGGDDYITKPFDNTELLIKIKSHLRLTTRTHVKTHKIIKIGDLVLDKERLEVKQNGVKIDLSTREFELLSYLMENAGIALTKEQIFSNVWGYEYGDIGTVAVNIKSLRDKLHDNDKYIITLWGYGYRFVRDINNE